MGEPFVGPLVLWAMHQLIYGSHAAVPFEAHHLEWLLSQARTFNEAHGITGLLLYGNEQFLQVLEGEQEAVHGLYARIQRDPRHHSIITYADKAIAQRAFADWHMAFQVLPPQQFLQVAGYLLPAEVQFDRPALSSADQQLLHVLRAFLLLA